MTSDTARRCAVHEAAHAVAAALYGAPIRWVSIDPAHPHLRRGRWQPSHDAGVEYLTTLCLCGPAAEECYCGPITDGGDATDLVMARDYLARQFGPHQIGAEIARLHDAAARLVRTDWARRRIALIADALLDCGTLSGAQIDGLLARIGGEANFVSHLQNSCWRTAA